MTATSLPELENALSTAFRAEPRPSLELEAPDLMGAWRDAEDRASAYRGQELAKAIIEWAEAHLHTDADRVEFLNDMVVALRENDDAVFRQTLRDWVRTADELADPESREVLLGEHDAADYEGVARPS